MVEIYILNMSTCTIYGIITIDIRNLILYNVR